MGDSSRILLALHRTGIVFESLAGGEEKEKREGSEGG
jgi:hypothetical protein